MSIKNLYNNLCLRCEWFYPGFAGITIIATTIALGFSTVWCAPCTTCDNGICPVTTILSSDDYTCRVELRYVRGSYVGYFSHRFPMCPEIGDLHDCFRKKGNDGDVTGLYFGKYDSRPFHEQCLEWTGIVVFVYAAVILSGIWVVIASSRRYNAERRALDQANNAPIDPAMPPNEPVVAVDAVDRDADTNDTDDTDVVGGRLEIVEMGSMHSQNGDGDGANEENPLNTNEVDSLV